MKKEKTTMEFKIVINGIETIDDNERKYIKARLEDSIKKSSFEWRNSFTVSNLDGYLNAYIDGLSKGEKIFNEIIDKR
tara:strand:+ start:299 stop:532 length:234 start_codon:yes stop_codon:yes gene_type:complete